MQFKRHGLGLDRNTILSLNKDPGSIDLHSLALAKMKNVRVDQTAKHDFIKDRMRSKNVKNIDDIYEKLNDLEKNGVLDIWINKFGKSRYMRGQNNTSLKESSFGESSLSNKIGLLIESVSSIIEEMGDAGAGAAGTAGGVAAGVTASSSNSPIASMNGPRKNGITIINQNPEGSHQDTHLGGK